mmetsp:Transcript_71744/g.155830  ORF Transcript_71744/g.155830 Transcript_71744/m.155830 type:complete len:108 (+) Transcript_71744:67-390(+)|eukprot:CAMPEP_0170596022 /NCGR_PEP_ID=MMETSP0224-20130122/14882_1 /TAXON_ID=285029 /ORGANISM="Togula jolla, Strain CCCM 725" /LENGTH=107 /DNA_ID=CAMNT_0010920259 /DNA_START=63 /DNA_END=386 /DNA_ORIENTATION=+
MAARRASALLIATVCAAAILCLFAASSRSFVAAPLESKPALRAGGASVQGEAASTAAALGVALAAIPEAAHAANQGYAVLQLGWAVFIIGLGPAVLFYIYFNKPELL